MLLALLPELKLLRMGDMEVEVDATAVLLLLLLLLIQLLWVLLLFWVVVLLLLCKAEVRQEGTGLSSQEPQGDGSRLTSPSSSSPVETNSNVTKSRINAASDPASGSSQDLPLSSSRSLLSGLNMDRSESPSIPSQFSALWMLTRSLMSSSSALPISPPFPLCGPNTTWLYRGSFTTGKPVGTHTCIRETHRYEITFHYTVKWVRKVNQRKKHARIQNKSSTHDSLLRGEAPVNSRIGHPVHAGVLLWPTTKAVQCSLLWFWWMWNKTIHCNMEDWCGTNI